MPYPFSMRVSRVRSRSPFRRAVSYIPEARRQGSLPIRRARGFWRRASIARTIGSCPNRTRPRSEFGRVCRQGCRSDPWLSMPLASALVAFVRRRGRGARSPRTMRRRCISRRERRRMHRPRACFALGPEPVSVPRGRPRTRLVPESVSLQGSVLHSLYGMPVLPRIPSRVILAMRIASCQGSASPGIRLARPARLAPRPVSHPPTPRPQRPRPGKPGDSCKKSRL